MRTCVGVLLSMKWWRARAAFELYWGILSQYTNCGRFDKLTPSTQKKLSRILFSTLLIRMETTSY